MDSKLNLRKHLRGHPSLDSVCSSTTQVDPTLTEIHRQLLAEHLYRSLPQCFGYHAQRHTDRTLCAIVLKHLRDLYYEIATNLLQTVCYEISTNPYKGGATTALSIKLADECLQRVRGYETNGWDDVTVITSTKQRATVSDISLSYFKHPDNTEVMNAADNVRVRNVGLKHWRLENFWSDSIKYPIRQGYNSNSMGGKTSKMMALPFIHLNHTQRLNRNKIMDRLGHMLQKPEGGEHVTIGEIYKAHVETLSNATIRRVVHYAVNHMRSRSRKTVATSWHTPLDGKSPYFLPTDDFRFIPRNRYYRQYSCKPIEFYTIAPVLSTTR